MKIELAQRGETTVVRLEGRLDVVWAEHVAASVREVLRSGRHALRLDASGVGYMSSAGIRALVQLNREVAAVKGTFRLERPSEFVEQALRMSGLGELIAEGEGEGVEGSGAPAGGHRTDKAGGMEIETDRLGGGAMALRIPARWVPWERTEEGGAAKLAFPAGAVGLGIGATGIDAEDAKARYGEFMAVEGCLVSQPADSQQRVPDYVEQTGNFVPEIHAIQALAAEGEFATLLRFRPEGEEGRLGMADLAAAVLDASGGGAAAFALVAEAEGLVGAALARSPGRAGPENDPWSFPAIREWVGFCGERIHGGKSVLAVGFAAKRGACGPLEPFLAPLPSRPGICAHVHAAAFPFRPLPEGAIPARETARGLFEAGDPIGLLHLLEDDRELTGLGQSAFVRGACWLAPLDWAGEGAP